MRWGQEKIRVLQSIQVACDDSKAFLSAVGAVSVPCHYMMVLSYLNREMP